MMNSACFVLLLVICALFSAGYCDNRLKVYYHTSDCDDQCKEIITEIIVPILTNTTCFSEEADVNRSALVLQFYHTDQAFAAEQRYFRIPSFKFECGFDVNAIIPGVMYRLNEGGYGSYFNTAYCDLKSASEKKRTENESSAGIDDTIPYL